jgi:hypothetical protein
VAIDVSGHLGGNVGGAFGCSLDLLVAGVIAGDGVEGIGVSVQAGEPCLRCGRLVQPGSEQPGIVGEIDGAVAQTACCVCSRPLDAEVR